MDVSLHLIIGDLNLDFKEKLSTSLGITFRALPKVGPVCCFVCPGGVSDFLTTRISETQFFFLHRNEFKQLLEENFGIGDHGLF